MKIFALVLVFFILMLNVYSIIEQAKKVSKGLKSVKDDKKLTPEELKAAEDYKNEIFNNLMDRRVTPDDD
jgi:hypothetical protein